MARPLRIELSGGLYHVTSRGDRREDIYFSDKDRMAWLELFGQVCSRFNWRCHAYCQMTNHYHLVIETLECSLAQGMRQLNGVYTQWVNRAHKRVGHVFQGRYKAILVEKDSYLLELARYVDCASSSTWDYRILRHHGRNSIHRTARYVTRTSGGVGGRGREASSYPD